jgi:hypothetical protein
MEFISSANSFSRAVRGDAILDGAALKTVMDAEKPRRRPAGPTGQNRPQGIKAAKEERPAWETRKGEGFRSGHRRMRG